MRTDACSFARPWLPVAAVLLWVVSASSAGHPQGVYAVHRTPVVKAVLELPSSPDIQPLPSGDYRIFYKDPQGRRRSWVFVPASKVRGSVTARVSCQPRAGIYTYRYQVLVAPDSPSPLEWFCTESDDPRPERVVTPKGWRFLGKSPFASILCWATAQGVRPGRTVTFEFFSSHPPGVGTAYLRGISPAPVAPPGTGETLYDPRPKRIFKDAALGETLCPRGDPAAKPYQGAWAPLAGRLPAGWRVTWDAATRTAIARPPTGAGRVQVEVGNAAAQVDGRLVVLAAPARMVEGRIAIPEADVSRLFGAGGG